MEEKLIRCDNCGQKADEGAKYCPFCGARMPSVSRRAERECENLPASEKEPWEIIPEENTVPDGVTASEDSSEEEAAMVPEEAKEPDTVLTSKEYREQNYAFRESGNGYGQKRKKKKGKKWLWLLLTIPVIALVVVGIVVVRLAFLVGKDTGKSYDPIEIPGSFDEYEGDVFPEYEEPETSPFDEGTEEYSIAVKGVFKDTVLYDKDGLTITALGSKCENMLFGYMIPVSVENHTEKTLVLSQDYMNINGYTVQAYVCEEIEAGGQVRADVALYNADLQYPHITDIAYMDFSFNLLDSQTYEVLETVDTDTVRTTSYESFEQKPDRSGESVYKKDGLEILLQDAVNKGYGYTELVFHVVNTSDKNYYLDSCNMTVNGYMASAYLTGGVISGTDAVFTATVYDDSVSTYGQSGTIEEIRFTVSVCDMATYYVYDISDTITVRPNVIRT